MATLLTADVYKTTSPILQFSDDWQAWAHTFTLANDEALTVEEDGRKIIKAGTFYPANDHTCQGLVLNDVDLSSGSANGAILFAGTVNESKLPEQPSGDAKYALPRVTYFPTVTAPGLGERLDPVEIPAATPMLMGGFKVGKHIDMAADGTASIAETAHGQYGVIKIGDTLDVSDDGTTDVVAATDAQRGGIRIGDGLNIDSDLASVTAGKGVRVDADGVHVDTGDGTKINDDNTLMVKLADDSGLTVDNNGLALSDATKAVLKESAPVEHSDSLSGEGTSSSPLGLNPASTALLGAVKVGAHLDVTADGVLSADSLNTALNTALGRERANRTKEEKNIYTAINRRARTSSVTLVDGEQYLTLDAHEGQVDNDKSYIKLGSNLTPITDSITAEVNRASDAEDALTSRVDTVETEASANSADLTGIKGLTYGTDMVHLVEAKDGAYTSPALTEIEHNISDAKQWTNVQGKPFESLGDNLTVTDGRLTAAFPVADFGNAIGRGAETAALASDATPTVTDYNNLVAAHNALLGEFNQLISSLETVGIITRPTA